VISWSIASEIHGVGCLAAQVKGARVYSRLKFESGVHRVQRVRLGFTNAQPSTCRPGSCCFGHLCSLAGLLSPPCAKSSRAFA